jgi:hypothetical protein
VRTYIVLLTVMVMFATGVRAFDITRCGQGVGDGQVGTLQADLDCPGFPGTCSTDPNVTCSSAADCPSGPPPAGCAIAQPTLGKKSTLMLNGHTITSHDPNTLQLWGVLANGPIDTITGPGTITVPGGTAVLFSGKKLMLTDVEIRDSRLGIVADHGGKVFTENVTLHDIASHGIENANGVRASNLTVSRCGTDTPSVSLGPVLDAIQRDAIDALKLKAVGLVATDNGGPAFSGKSAKIVNGTLSGNDASGAGFDILTFKKPHLSGTSCQRSGHLAFGPPPPAGAPELLVIGSWSVCPGD